jgi:hypothetical protein
MNAAALLTLLAAWLCFFLAPSGGFSRVLQLLVFGGLGVLFTLAGGFQYWWNSSMMPSEKSAFMLVCGIGTLASQVGTVLMAVFASETGSDWSEPRPGRRWRE